MNSTHRPLWNDLATAGQIYSKTIHEAIDRPGGSEAALPLVQQRYDQFVRLTDRAVAQGQGYLSPAVSDAVLSDYRKHVTDPIDLLTTREREVLQMIAEGNTNKEIATALGLSTYTVESHRGRIPPWPDPTVAGSHRGRIMEKLNLHSAGELVRFAFRNGLIS